MGRWTETERGGGQKTSADGSLGRDLLSCHKRKARSAEKLGGKAGRAMRSKIKNGTGGTGAFSPHSPDPSGGEQVTVGQSQRFRVKEEGRCVLCRESLGARRVACPAFKMETPDVKDRLPMTTTTTNARSGAEQTPLEGRVTMLDVVGQSQPRWLWRIQRWLSEHLGHCSYGPIGQK